nr:immunoglobulin light chain junction region [Macaca mulatta]
CQHGFGIPVTC